MSLVSAVLSHLLTVYLAAVLPILGGKSFRELKRLVYVDPGARARFYRQNLYFGWATVTALAVIMASAGQPLKALGLWLPMRYDLRFAAGLVLAVVYIAYIMKKPSPGYVRKYLTPVAPLLPFTAGERRLWAAVSVKAGIVEELAYRGFLFYYLARNFPGIPVLAVILITGAVFGAAHVYQGMRGFVASFLAGTVFGCIYALTGTLLPVMAVHILTDLRVLRIWK